MADRPIFHPQLAQYFRQLRERQGWGQNQASDIALKRRGLKLLTRNVLLRLENGKTKWPDPAVLKQLAQLYRMDYAEMVGRVIEHSYGVQFELGEAGLRLDDRDEAASGDFVPVRVLDDKIAAGPPLTINEAEFSGYQVFSKRWLDRQGIGRPLCVTVGHRERSMLGTIDPGEIVLLDCAEERRLAPKTDRIYGLNLDGGSTLKRIVVLDRGLLLVADNPDKDTYPTRALELQEDQSLLDVIVGEVMWKGQPL